MRYIHFTSWFNSPIFLALFRKKTSLIRSHQAALRRRPNASFIPRATQGIFLVNLDGQTGKSIIRPPGVGKQAQKRETPLTAGLFSGTNAFKRETFGLGF